MDSPVTDDTGDDSPAAEVRRRYLYRQLLLRSKTHLPREVLRRLVGPDCAYHLYRWETADQPATPDDSPTEDSSPAGGKP